MFVASIRVYFLGTLPRARGGETEPRGRPGPDVLPVMLRGLGFTWKQTEVEKLDQVVLYEDDRAYGDPETVTI